MVFGMLFDRRQTAYMKLPPVPAKRPDDPPSYHPRPTLPRLGGKQRDTTFEQFEGIPSFVPDSIVTHVEGFQHDTVNVAPYAQFDHLAIVYIGRAYSALALSNSYATAGSLVIGADGTKRFLRTICTAGGIMKNSGAQCVDVSATEAPLFLPGDDSAPVRIRSGAFSKKDLLRFAPEGCVITTYLSALPRERPQPGDPAPSIAAAVLYARRRHFYSKVWEYVMVTNGAQYRFYIHSWKLPRWTATVRHAVELALNAQIALDLRKVEYT